MATEGVTTPYSTVAPFMGAPPAWLRADDAERILSYDIYEQIYWNNDTAYQVSGRGDNIPPIYVPSGRTIVDTTNRYVGAKFGWAVTPGTDPQLTGTPEQQAVATQVLTAFFRRERFLSKFAMNKRFGMIRGDWLWHIYADPDKPEGSRISIRAIHPGAWFPVYDDNDPERLVKIHIVDLFRNDADEERLKRLTYEYAPEGIGIIMSEAVYEFEDWWKPETSPETIITPPTLLPAEIPSFPVYHIPNFEEPANPYGSSELRGVERIIQAVSQAVSDEDIALALEGLGVYATDTGGPVDEDGEDANWDIYPGTVLENAGGFKRVGGIGSLEPYDSHIGRLINFLKEASATPDVAIGRVDVQVAESGVALALQMSPMLGKAAEKDQIIIDVHTQMFYDLKWWFKIYEGVDFTMCEVLPTLGDKLPVNVDKEIERAVLMVEAGLWSKQTAREELAKKGIVFAQDEEARVTADGEAAAASAEGELDQRISTELSTLGGASGG